MDPKRKKNAKSEAAWEELDASSLTKFMQPLATFAKRHGIAAVAA
jgi:hypothetical protein